MIFRRFLTIAALAASVGAALAAPNKRGAPAANDGNPVLAAHAAFRAGDALKLARHAPALKGHVLEPYAEYWGIRLGLDDAGARDVRAFLTRHAGSYLADRLRADWLRELGRRGDWQSFDLTLESLVQDDLEIRCYAWLSRIARRDKGAYAEARAVWLEPRELPEGCNTLVDKMIGAGELTIEDVWQRMRLLFENGQLSAAKGALEYFPDGEAPEERLLSQAASAPQKLLAQLPPKIEPRATREMARLAFVRLARNDPQAAADLLRGSFAKRLPASDLKYLWGRVGYEGARRLDAQALKWFRLAGGAQLNDEQLAWRTRAALRAGDWQGVRDAIDPMSAAARQDAAWTYWYGRALGAQGSEDGARAYFLRISGQPHFYGLLAAEELGYVVAVPEPFHAATEEEVQAARSRPGLARALELYRLDLRTEATREWLFTIRGMDDQQLLAAAELARRAEVFDRAINTADKTAFRHNYKVRFLAPFRDVFSMHARSFELEEAWVLGLVRQESRFIVNARSSAGAQGLMQLMPATARWVARRIGLKDYHPARVIEVQTNVTLGTRYLKFVLDDLGHPLLASAAYNAGPGRARRWRDAKPLEGAIYAETIPFNETRDYVKKVMANTMYYSQLVGGKILPLKDRLGVIPARSPSDRFNEELP